MHVYIISGVAVLLLDFSFTLPLLIDQSAFWKEMWAYYKMIACTTLAVYVLENSILAETWHSSMEDSQ